MTEKIKSAVEWFEDFVGFYSLSEDEKKMFYLAINSLKAWSEVLNELENMREIIWQDIDDDARIVRANAWDKFEMLVTIIDIINQKLEQIEE